MISSTLFVPRSPTDVSSTCASSFALCTEVEFPPAIPTYDITLEGTTACLPTDLQ